MLYIDSRVGISGTRLLGALVDIMDQPDLFIRQFNDLGLGDLKAVIKKDSDGAMQGTRIEFNRVSADSYGDDEYDDEYEDDDDDEIGGFFSFGKQKTESKSSGRHSSHRAHDRTLKEISAIIDEMPLSGKVRKRAISVFEHIAKAASKTHNKPVGEVALHRAGTRDVIASVVGVCIILEDMSVDTIICSSVNVGTGVIMSSAGKVSVPTPTLKLLLENIPYSQGKEEGEICSLEGAAILCEYVDEFRDMPDMAVIREGIGLGTRKIKNGSNYVKISVGTEVKTDANTTMTELEAVLYGDSAEALKLTGEKLRELGVYDIFAMPVMPFGGGSGTLVKCIVANDSADEAAREILKNTSAENVRRKTVSAYMLDVTKKTVQSSLGEVEINQAAGYGVKRKTPSPGSIAAIARERNISIREAYDTVAKEI